MCAYITLPFYSLNEIAIFNNLQAQRQEACQQHANRGLIKSARQSSRLLAQMNNIYFEGFPKLLQIMDTFSPLLIINFATDFTAGVCMNMKP